MVNGKKYKGDINRSFNKPHFQSKALMNSIVLFFSQFGLVQQRKTVARVASGARQ